MYTSLLKFIKDLPVTMVNLKNSDDQIVETIMGDETEKLDIYVYDPEVKYDGLQCIVTAKLDIKGRDRPLLVNTTPFGIVIGYVCPYCKTHFSEGSCPNCKKPTDGTHTMGE